MDYIAIIFGFFIKKYCKTKIKPVFCLAHVPLKGTVIGHSGRYHPPAGTETDRLMGDPTRPRPVVVTGHVLPQDKIVHQRIDIRRRTGGCTAVLLGRGVSVRADQIGIPRCSFL